MNNRDELMFGERTNEFGADGHHFGMGSRLATGLTCGHSAVDRVGTFRLGHADVLPVIGLVDRAGVSSPLVGVGYEAWPNNAVYQCP